LDTEAVEACIRFVDDDDDDEDPQQQMAPVRVSVHLYMFLIGLKHLNPSTEMSTKGDKVSY